MSWVLHESFHAFIVGESTTYMVTNLQGSKYTTSIAVHVKCVCLVVCLLVCIILTYLFSTAHISYIGIERSLLTGNDAPLLRQITRDLLHVLSHRYDYTWTAFIEPVVSTGDNILVDLHLSDTNYCVTIVLSSCPLVVLIAVSHD